MFEYVYKIIDINGNIVERITVNATLEFDAYQKAKREWENKGYNPNEYNFVLTH